MAILTHGMYLGGGTSLKWYLALWIRMSLCLRERRRWQIHLVVVGLVLSSLFPLPIFDLELTIRFVP
jgi:hypothetical protein